VRQNVIFVEAALKAGITYFLNVALVKDCGGRW
jgi:hypothetical protein